MSAELVRAAFQRAEDKLTARDITQREFWATIEDYIEAFADDRRFKLHVKASTIPVSSAIVSYRGVRYYLYGVYDTETQSRNYAISRTN